MHRRVAYAVLVAGLVACNSIVGFSDLERVGGSTRSRDGGNDDDDTGSSGSSGSSGTSGDPIPTGPRCNPSKRFEDPVLAPEFEPTARAARGVVVASSGLEAFFVVGVPGNAFELRRMTRGSLDAEWKAAGPVPLHPPPLAGLSLAANDRKLYYHACIGTSPTVCSNWIVSRPSGDTVFAGDAGEFAPPIKVQIDYFVVSTADVAYWSAPIPDAGPTPGIVSAPVNENGIVYNLEKEVPNVHVVGFSDDRPILNASQTVMYLSSKRPGSTAGADDIWRTSRPSKNVDFATPSHVLELSGPGTDHVSWVSDDDCEVFLSRSDHVYYARRGK